MLFKLRVTHRPPAAFKLNLKWKTVVVKSIGWNPYVSEHSQNAQNDGKRIKPLNSF